MGGLIQLIFKGSQDVFLTGNPEITFFKMIYHRYKNFSKETIIQEVKGTVGLGKKVSCIVSRNGDLLSNMYIKLNVTITHDRSGGGQGTGMKLPGYFPAEQLIEYIEFKIGNKVIDYHDTYWFRVYDEFYRNFNEKLLYLRMTNYTNKMTWPELEGVNISWELTVNPSTQNIYLPFCFYFCRDISLAIPLVSLQYEDVRFNIKFQNKSNPEATMGIPSAQVINYVSLYGDYIFLDSEERYNLINNKQEYLIEQVQILNTTVDAGVENNISLNFNNPVKSLFWIFTSDFKGEYNYGLLTPLQTQAYLKANPPSIFQWLFPTGASLHRNSKKYVEAYGGWYTYMFGQQQMVKAREGPLNKASLIFAGGIRRVPINLGSYYNIQTTTLFKGATANPLYCYSFALDPCNVKPTGTCNFSRLDDIILSLESINSLTTSHSYPITATTTLNKVKIYGVNYNVLKIENVYLV